MTDFTAYLRLGVDSRDAVSAQRDLDRMAAAGDKSDKSFKQLSSTSKLLGASIGGIGLAAAAAQVINYADAWTNVSNVLMGVTDSSAAFASTQAKVLALSKDTFSSLEGTAGLYSEITRSVSELGINQERVLGVTRTINNLFLAGGKAASETAGAIRQLNQGLASGALRGDEFNSVAEGAPRILDALSQKLNITKGELRGFAAEGKITAELLIGALEDYSDEAQRAVDTTTRTFSQSAELARTFALEFVGASDGIKDFSATAGSALVTVAQNLDLVSDAVIVLSAAYGARLAGSLATATAAKVAYIATLARTATGTTALATATKGLGAAMTLLGGPVGVAILAGGALYYLATSATEAEETLDNLRASSGAASERLTDMAKSAQAVAAIDLSEKLSGLVNLRDELSQSISDDSFFSEEYLIRTTEDIRLLNEEISRLQSQLDSIKPPTAQVQNFVNSISSLNNVLGFFVTGNGVSKPFSMFSEGAANLKTFSEEYQKLSSDIEKQIALFGDEKKSSEIAYLARTGQLKEMSAEEVELLVKRYEALEQLQATAEKTKELNDAEKSRAESVASSIAELEKQNALFDNQSKYAEILYQIEAGLLKVTDAEKARYLAAAQTNDQLVANKNLADSIDAFAKKSEEDKAALDEWVKSIDEFGGAWTRTGSVIADALGGIGDALDDYSSRMAAIAAEEKNAADLRKKHMGDPRELEKISKAEKKLASERTAANLKSFSAISGAASQMFSEQSKGRKALHAIEKTLAAVEIAMAIQNTATEIALSMKRSAAATTETGVNVAAGAAKMFAQSGWGGFAGVAAMIAAMAALGFSGGGGGGGASAKDIQDAQGTGTVLGSDDKSESIANAMEMYNDIGLEQLSELRGIRDAMTGLSSGIAKLAVSLVSTNRFSGAEVSGLGTTLKDGSQIWGGDVSKILKEADFLGIVDKALGALFGSTKKKLTDSGLQIGAQELGDVLAGDLSVFYYNTIETTKKKLFGLSKKKSTQDELTGADAALVAQFDQIFTFIGTAVSESIDVLGIESTRAIESFKINIGKISFKDLSGEEIQSELNAIFSQQADLIAEYVVPAMKEYQLMGEGLFETLTRVAKEMATFNHYTEVLNLNFSATGLAAIAAQQAIAEFSGGMDKLTQNLQSYYDEFFTEEERAANQMKLLAAEMKNLGYDTVPTSREAFRKLVEDLVKDTGLMTEESQKTFAGLIALSEAFADLVPATEAAADAMETAEEAMSRLNSAAQSSFDALSKSVSAERARIQGIVNSANSAKQALDKALAAEKNTITDAYNERIDFLKSQADAEREANNAIAQARIDALNEEAAAVRDRIGGLRSLFDELSGAAADMALGGSIAARRRAAEFEIDTALRNAQAGRGLPTDGRISDALSALRENPASLYANAQEMAFANDVTRNKINDLAALTGKQLTREEKSLAAIERQVAAAERAAQVTTTSFDALIEQANAQYAADLAALESMQTNAQLQYDALTGIDTRTLSVEEALTKFNESLLAADFEDAQQQYARLDGILEQGKLQLDTLLDIDTGVLSLRDAIDRFAAAVASADQQKVNEEMLAEMRRTADELNRLREEQRVQALTQQAKLDETARNTRITANEALA